MGQDFSRRTFLGASAAAAASLVGASMACADEAAPQQGAASKPADVRCYSTDVVVIGAGAAGTRAAIGVLDAGADVIIIDKKQWAHCGDSGLHYSGRMTSSDFGIEGDCVDAQLENACIQGGYMVDQDLGREVLEAYAEDRVTLMSENFGDIHFRDFTNGKPLIGLSSNKPRVWPGFKLVNMAYEALDRGARVMDYCVATKIVTSPDGTIAGVTCVDFRTGEFFLIRAKAVVLASGGDTGLWGAGVTAARYGGGCENLVGDGHAMAASFGVTFRDLEFRSLYSNLGVIYPTAFNNFGCAYCGDLSAFRDVNGNHYLKDSIDAGESISLRRATYEWYKAVLEGRGTPEGGVYATPDSYLVGTGGGISKTGVSNDAYDQLRLTWERAGYDLSQVEAAPQQIYDYGGIVTNIKGETGVEGLYAAGECAMHSGAGYGAMRMFSSCMVMGKRAGESAGEFAGGCPVAPVAWDQVGAERDRVLGMLEADPEVKIRPHELKHLIQDSAWKGSGALRSEKRCLEALAEFDEEEAQLANLYIMDKSRACNLEWMEALMLSNMITMARMDTLASMERKESRGTHLRNDYPDMDNDAWLKNIYLTLEDGEFVLSTRDAVLTSFVPEPGKFPQGGDVIEGF